MCSGVGGDLVLDSGAVMVLVQSSVARQKAARLHDRESSDTLPGFASVYAQPASSTLPPASMENTPVGAGSPSS